MKTLLRSTAIALTLSAGLTAVAAASSSSKNPLVNEYGEPAGFGNLPEVAPPDAHNATFSQSQPGSGGLYLLPGAVDRRNFESHGAWQARIAAESRGTVTIGPLEVLESGPTGPMTPAAIEVARDEVTAQVLTRIKATDHVMSSLKSRAKSLDQDGQARFKAAADEVAQRRAALREDLKTVRASGGDEWSQARTAVAVSFNAYVDSMHRAQAVVTSVTTE